ncbi:MAG: hypothetical protein OXG33_13250 [Chloroflexi bacterium]|nr:hypothetical protein [Chloroflexota bacterium]
MRDAGESAAATSWWSEDSSRLVPTMTWGTAAPAVQGDRSGVQGGYPEEGMMPG